MEPRPAAESRPHLPLAARWLLPLAFLLPIVAHAQSVHWDVDPNSPSMVQLVFEGCAPDGQPTLPAISDATLTFVGQSQNTSIVNFTMTSSVTFSYLVRAKTTGPIHIPAFTVKTDKGTLRVAAFDGGSPAAALGTVATAKLVPEKTSVWAGEVFGLSYQLSASRRNNPQGIQNFDWNAAPLVAEDWSKPDVTEDVFNGDHRVQVTYRTRVYAKAPNTLKLEAASVVLNIQTGTVGFGFLQQPRMEPISVVSDQPLIEVKPLPTAPAGFSGAVGQFKLTSKIVPEKAGIGEPITWTLELSGTGNWPDISGLPSRDVSRDFQVVQPKPKRTPAEGKLFDVTLTDDVVLVPSKAGKYDLGPISLTYFDPKSGSYKTLTTPRQQITITPPAAPQIKVPTPGAAANAGAPEISKSEPATASRPPAQPPSAAAPPSGVPRDPLPGSDIAPLPLSVGRVIGWSAAPFAALLAFWFGLAVWRAKKTDPLAPRREARARLAATLAKLESAPPDQRPALLLAWQRDTAVLWQVAHAAPSARTFDETMDPAAAAWAKLWAESDRALYGPRGDVAPDWLVRAHEALAARRVPGFQLSRLFRPQNLFPFAAAIAVGLLISAAGLRAEDGSAAYRRGDFAAAEKAWRDAVAAHPTDSFARHNLSLALAQQERAGEAAAQAAAAFVQHPSERAIRWQFGLATEKAGAAPAALVAFLNPGPLQDLACFLSPSEWQRVFIGAAWVAAIAIGGMLLNAYGRRRRAILWSAVGLLGLSILVATLSIAGIAAYGEASDARAVVVARAGLLRSIPTEADTTQKTAPLTAGALAIADKALLGWVRLGFENGQTGWVRKEDVVPLWK